MTGGVFYDEAVTAAYLAHRHGGIHSPNTVMEEPALLAALGDIDGARLLDLGCGDGSFAELALAQGARSYTGIVPPGRNGSVAAMLVSAVEGTDDCYQVDHFEVGSGLNEQGVSLW